MNCCVNYSGKFCPARVQRDRAGLSAARGFASFGLFRRADRIIICEAPVLRTVSLVTVLGREQPANIAKRRNSLPIIMPCEIRAVSVRLHGFVFEIVFSREAGEAGELFLKNASVQRRILFHSRSCPILPKRYAFNGEKKKITTTHFSPFSTTSRAAFSGK